MTNYSFMSGLVTMGFFIACLFFMRYWRQTRDLLFLAFAVAFALLGLNQALLALSQIPVEERSWLYLLRLAAFATIMAAVFYKNRRLR